MGEAVRSVFEAGVRVGDRYQLGPRLGAGGAGQIFEATDERLGRIVAVKVVRTPELADRATLARLEREARAAARIRHPNIVDVTDFGTTAEGYPFLVMTRLVGETLEQRIELGPLPVSLAIDLHIQLLDALAAAHAAGVLHRDVKPANVLVNALPSGTPMLTLLDFGLAALAEGASAGAGKLTDGGIVLGSPAYLPPERLLGRAADVRSDLYAVGVCLFESLTSRRPFEAPSALALRGRILGGDAPRARELRPELGSELDAIVARALARDPEERFPTAAAMRDALKGLSARGAPTLHGEPSDVVTPKPSPRPRTRAWGLAVLVLIVVPLLVWGLAGVSAEPAPRPPEPITTARASTVSIVPASIIPASIAPVSIVPTAIAPPPSSAAVARPEPHAIRHTRPVVEPEVATPVAEPVDAPPPRPTPVPSIDRPIEPVW